MKFICDELDELERKIDKGKLSMAEVQYADVLAHLKKDLLTSEAMESEGEYSRDDGSYKGYSYRRGRDGMGRYTSRDSHYYDDSSRGYSRDNNEMLYRLEEMKKNAKDDDARHMIDNWIGQLK
jgi:hypothetical protein